MDEVKKRFAWIIGVFVVAVAVCTYGYWQKVNSEDTILYVDKVNTERLQSAPKNVEATIYISGAVVKPGIIAVPAGSRVVDAVERAGGMAPGADVNKINLAQLVKDGMHIHVPSSAVKVSPPVSYSGNTSIDTIAVAGKTSINRADKTQLDKLPGIGPALAERIIEYRQTNGLFRSIEELRNVQGISDGKYQKIKDQIIL